MFKLLFYFKLAIMPKLRRDYLIPESFNIDRNHDFNRRDRPLKLMSNDDREMSTYMQYLMNHPQLLEAKIIGGNEFVLPYSGSMLRVKTTGLLPPF